MPHWPIAGEATATKSRCTCNWWRHCCKTHALEKRVHFKLLNFSIWWTPLLPQSTVGADFTSSCTPNKSRMIVETRRKLWPVSGASVNAKRQPLITLRQGPSSQAISGTVNRVTCSRRVRRHVVAVGRRVPRVTIRTRCFLRSSLICVTSTFAVTIHYQNSRYIYLLNWPKYRQLTGRQFRYPQRRVVKYINYVLQLFVFCCVSNFVLPAGDIDDY